VAPVLHLGWGLNPQEKNLMRLSLCERVGYRERAVLGSSLSELSVWVQARKVVFDEVQSFAKGKVAAGQELTVAEISQLQSSLRKRLLATEVSLRTTQFRVTVGQS
jgi:hypothetical protein